jgi:thiamine-phosphate pyrophosphorylase
MAKMTTAAERRERLTRARLYLVADGGMADAALDAALSGGVDMVQLRDPALDDDALLARARTWRALCDKHGALLWINDRPDVALRAQADGVHVGQDDMPVAAAREAGGPELLVGLSTHALAQLLLGIEAGADQLSVGPVWETPTKPGRPASGLQYVREAAELRPPRPWFAIGGIDGGNVDEVAAAGAERVVVARAIREAADPGAAAAFLRAGLEEASLGAAQ